MTGFFRKFGNAVISIFGTLWVMVPTSPLLSPLTNRDSGVFLYGGWRLLNGDIP